MAISIFPDKVVAINQHLIIQDSRWKPCLSDYDGSRVEGSTQAAEFVYLGENASGIDG